MKNRKVALRNLVVLAIFLYFLILTLLISYIQSNKCQSIIKISNKYASRNDLAGGGVNSYSIHHYYTNLLCGGGIQTIENSIFENNYVESGRAKREILSKENGNGEIVGGSVLIDLTNFDYIINNDICGTKEVYIITIVHTAPKHFKERQAIRSTWGRPDIFRHISTKVAFLIADLSLPPISYLVNESRALELKQQLQARIQRENDVYGDIIQGNFIDSYHNLTYKNIMGKKWVSEQCPQARFVLKTDDDMFVDMFQLIEFLEDEYSSTTSSGAVSNEGSSTKQKHHSLFPFSTALSHLVKSSNDRKTGVQSADGSKVPADLLMCYLFASSPAVSDSSHENAKWLVDKSQFAGDIYPPYCSGRAYVTTTKLSGRIYKASAGRKYFWIDDVYVTGILAQELGVVHVEVNDLYNLYDALITMEWLGNGQPEPLKFVFAYSENGHITFYKLWNKTVAEHTKLRQNYRRDILLQRVERKMASLMGMAGVEMEENGDNVKESFDAL